MSSDIVERIPISQIAYNAGLEIRYAIARSGVDPIQHIPEVDAIIERRLVEARREMTEEILGALTAHELYQYRPKAFNGFIEYARRLAEQEGSDE